MANQALRTDAFYILAGIGVLGLVAWMASHQDGNTLQPTSAASAPPPSPSQATGVMTAGMGMNEATGAPVSTNTLAMDMTALPDPLTSIPAGAFGGSMAMPGMFVETPSGMTIPFMPGVDYALGSIVHYADGSVQIF